MHSQPMARRYPPEAHREAGIAPRLGRSPFARLTRLVLTVWACLAALSFPGLSQSGTQQSPIDITGANTLYCASLPAIQPLYPTSATLSMVLPDDSGHGANITVTVAVAAPNTAPQLVIGSDTYGLRDFHFHYHAEHLTDGQQAAMEMHLVHTNQAGSLLVLGRFIEIGTTDVDAMGPIFNNLPSTPNATVQIDGFDPTLLLPKTLSSYRYYGSLTTGSSEPFAEPVKWVVLHEPMYLSDTQIANFKNIIHENFREPQLLNGRTVLTDVAGYASPPSTVPAADALPYAWQISDLSSDSGSGGIAYIHTLDHDDKLLADSAGWHATVVSRMTQGGGANGPAQFMVYGNGTRRFVVAWDLNASGLTALLYTSPGTANHITLPTSGTATTAYHRHELWYDPAAQQANYYFDGGLIATWSGSSPDSNQDGVFQWGGVSTLGQGVMNYQQVQFAINGEGPQAEYFPGFQGVSNSSIYGWSYGGTTPTDATATGIYPDTLPEPEFIGSYASATDVPLTTTAFTATCKTATFDLLPNYAPVAGTVLPVIQNLGSAPINGTFANLPQGQPVVLTNNTGAYQFVASYIGGDGNDLVLAWPSPYAWGGNASGELGNGTSGNTAGSAVAVTATVLANRTVVAFDAGTSHSLALLSDGTVAAWGLGDSGQLGQGDFSSSSVPVLVKGLPADNPVVAIAAGSFFSLALCEDGSLFAWGDNSAGQLGNGQGPTRPTPLPRSATPVQVVGPLAGKHVLAIAAGSGFGLAVTEPHNTDATLYAWGDNSSGQLGNGTSGSTAGSDLPGAVTTTPGPLAGKTVVDLDAGLFHAVALCSDGTIAAWGLNQVGQLGATTASAINPVPVALTSLGDLANRTVVAVKCGAYHTFALCSDGNAAAWGWGQYGQLGSFPGSQSTSTPTLVATTKPFKALAAGYYHSVGLYADGTLATWGWNNVGQLGAGSPKTPDPTAFRSTPLIVSAANQPYVAIGAGDTHSLATAANVTTALPAPQPSHTLRLAVESEGASVGPRLSGPASPQHRVRLTVQSQPNRPHAIQYKDSLSEPAWKHLHRANTDAKGILEHIYTQPDGTSQRFYRSLQE